MIIEDIPQENRKIKEQIWRSFKYYILYALLAFIHLTGGGFLFFYIEECYYPQSITSAQPKQSPSCLQVCNAISQLNKTILNTTSEGFLALENATRLCVENNCIDEESTTYYPNEGCNITLMSISKWIEYCVTVAFTIGMWLQ